MRLWLASALLTFCPLSAAMAGDPAAGEKAFAKCMACHAVGPDARNKVGPALNGLDGRTAGSVKGYSYSAANQKSGIVWNEQTFLQYIRSPQAAIPSTKMLFAGVTNARERADLWAYLRQFNGDGSKSQIAETRTK